MRTIEALYSERPLKPLAHYTSIQGLCGILTYGNLWATHIQFLNDSKEFIHAIELARSYLLEIKSNARFPGFSALIDHMIERIDAMPGSTWIISLSTQVDLLSQWRGYCAGGGYNLSFDPGKLAELAERQSFVLCKCTYDRDRQTELIRELVEFAIDSYPGYISSEEFDQDSTEKDRMIRFCAKWLFPRMSRLATREFDEGSVISRRRGMEAYRRALQTSCCTFISFSRIYRGSAP